MVIPLRRSIINLVIVLLFLVGCSSNAGKSLEPHDNNGKKWRIAYYEGGAFDHYQGELIAVVHGLQTLGWLDEFELSNLPDDIDTTMLWSCLQKTPGATRSNSYRMPTGPPDGTSRPGRFIVMRSSNA